MEQVGGFDFAGDRWPPAIDAKWSVRSRDRTCERQNRVGIAREIAYAKALEIKHVKARGAICSECDGLASQRNDHSVTVNDGTTQTK
ncbi:hypothetical protein NKI65_30495 [Mesorhizobium sp. M0578]